MDVQLSRDLASLNLSLDALDEWIVVVDADTKIKFINRPYAQFLGVKQEDVYGRYIVDVIEIPGCITSLPAGKKKSLSCTKSKGGT